MRFKRGLPIGPTLIRPIDIGIRKFVKILPSVSTECRYRVSLPSVSTECLNRVSQPSVSTKCLNRVIFTNLRMPISVGQMSVGPMNSPCL